MRLTLNGTSRRSLTVVISTSGARLTDEQFDDIGTELLRRIEGSAVHTSSWNPGSDWTGTVFEPIYTDACHHDNDASGRCFGLFLWVVMMKHPDVWGFGRYEKDATPIEGLTYFRIDNPPPQ